MSVLLPDGIDSLHDCPYTLHGAICAALRILDYEEFPTDERPPKRIWLDGERLKEHWSEVERRRNEKYGNAPEPDDDDADSSPLAQRNAVELITRG